VRHYSSLRFICSNWSRVIEHDEIYEARPETLLFLLGHDELQVLTWGEGVGVHGLVLGNGVKIRGAVGFWPMGLVVAEARSWGWGFRLGFLLR